MKARVFIYLVVAIGLMITTLDIETPTPGESAAPPPTFNRQIYEVTIEGTVGNLPFSREGSLFIDNTKTADTPEGLNRINLWLVSGDPTRRGEQGAITLATSNRFYVNGSKIDFAATSALNFAINAFFGEEVEINKNAFSFNGVNFETLSKIVIGQMHVELLQGGEVAGTVILTGSSLETGQVLGYTADFHGHYLASQ